MKLRCCAGGLKKKTPPSTTLPSPNSCRCARFSESRCEKYFRFPLFAAVHAHRLALKEDDSLPAANRMGYAFLTRQFAATHHWEKLLAGVRDETAYIKKYRVGIDFVKNMAIAQRVPFLLPLLLKTSHCLATTVLTNIGDATRRLRRRFPVEAGRALIGGLPLEYIKVTPPVRPGTRPASA